MYYTLNVNEKIKLVFFFFNENEQFLKHTIHFLKVAESIFKISIKHTYNFHNFQKVFNS